LPNNAAAVVVEHSERRRRSADDDHDDDGADDGADGVERRKGVQRCKVCRALIRMAWLSTSWGGGSIVHPSLAAVLDARTMTLLDWRMI